MNRHASQGKKHGSPDTISQAPMIVESACLAADRVRERAFEIFQERCAAGRPGDAVADWVQAERELSASLPDRPRLDDVEVKVRTRGEMLLASGAK